MRQRRGTIRAKLRQALSAAGTRGDGPAEVGGRGRAQTRVRGNGQPGTPPQEACASGNGRGRPRRRGRPDTAERSSSNRLLRVGAAGNGGEREGRCDRVEEARLKAARWRVEPMHSPQRSRRHRGPGEELTAEAAARERAAARSGGESRRQPYRYAPGQRPKEKPAEHGYGCKTMLSPLARRWFSTTTAPLPIRALASHEPLCALPTVAIRACTSML